MVEVNRDRGQAAVVVVVAAATLFAASSVALVGVGGVVVDRARAQSVADAAALAGVLEGPQSARDVADTHGAVVVSLIEATEEVTIVVRVGRATATARASAGP